MMLTGSYRYCGGKIVQSIPITENKIIQRLFGFCLAVFLLCLAAIVPLLIAEGYSGQDAPYETLEMYDKLESILGWLILSSMLVPAVVWVLVEVWRSIRSRFKVKVTQVVVAPSEYASGEVIYPYERAK